VPSAMPHARHLFGPPNLCPHCGQRNRLGGATKASAPPIVVKAAQTKRPESGCLLTARTQQQYAIT
jgi:hypothetical protein